MRKIQNFEQLATNNLRKAALKIAEAGLEAIDTPTVVRQSIRVGQQKLIIKNKEFSLENVRRFLVVVVGKCALKAGAELEQILGERISDGIVLDIQEGTLKRLRAYKGSHPFPTEENIKAAREIINLLSGLTESDFVLFLISGGGSTLLCQPKSLTCQDEASIVQFLFRAGATIQELNTIRKHLSLARGGYLAKYAYPARVVSLFFSDVPGDNLEFIASGPTVKDATTKEDAEKIIEKYKVKVALGLSRIELVETPKEEKYFENAANILLVSNEVALSAMAAKAGELGFAAAVKTAALTGEVREVSQRIVQELQDAVPHSALLYGGETTVIIKKEGKGGRNLELALSALRFIKEGELLMAVASDGKDNTDFAGAICDEITKGKALQKDFDIEQCLENNCSYQFFQELGEYIFTGDTGSNVSDLIIAMRE